MRYLTLKRPWPAAILYLGKRIENRPKWPWESLFGERFGIHAGKGWDAEGAVWIENLIGAGGLPGPDGRKPERPHYDDVLDVVNTYHAQCEVQGIVATAVLEGAGRGRRTESGILVGENLHVRLERVVDDVWYAGMPAVGYVLGGVKPLTEPVPCRGFLGWPEMKPEIETLVRERGGMAL